MSTAPPVITVTFTECAENHVGNQQLGTKRDTGMTLADLAATSERMTTLAATLGMATFRTELVIFNPTIDAGILLLHHMDLHTPSDATAVASLLWDAHYYDARRKKVLNKIARHNLCFTDTAQDPDYAHGMGRTSPPSPVRRPRVLQ